MNEWLMYGVLALISCAVAVFGSLTGVGGGIIFMPILLALYPGRSAEELTFISLVMVMANATVAMVNYLRMRRIDAGSALLFTACTIPTTILARFLQPYIPRRHFAMAFGIMMMAMVITTLVRARRRDSDFTPPPMPPRPGWINRNFTDSTGRTFAYTYSPWWAVMSGLIAGFVASFFGVGGGVIHVPIMTQLANFPAHVATATSIMILLFTALTAIVTDVGRHGLHVPFAPALAAGSGALIGAQIGTLLARRIKGRTLMYILVVALVIAGIKLMVSG